MASATDPGDDNEDDGTSLAEERTHYAEDRTILASERTFAGWMRSSMACIAIGVGFHALFAKVDPPWLPRAIATAFLLLSVLVMVAAARRASAVVRRLSTHAVARSKRINLNLITATVSAGALVLAVAIWTLPIG